MGDTVRKLFKYLFRIVLVPAVPLLALPFLMYIPAVQRYAKDRLVGYVERRMGIKAEVGSFSLKFPFRIQVENLLAGRGNADTLLYVGQCSLDVGLSGLLRKEVAVEGLSLHTLVLNYADTLSGMRLSGGLETLELAVPAIRWGEKRMTVASLALMNGEVRFAGGNTGEDTPERKALDWVLDLQQLELAGIRYAMNTASLPFLSAQLEKCTVVHGSLDLGRQWIKADSAEVRGGACRIRTSRRDGDLPVGIADNADTAGLWAVEAGRVILSDCAFVMDAEQGKGVVLDLSRIGIRIDSVYNRGSTIKAVLKDLHAVRREGGEIKGMMANVDLDDRKSEVTGAYLRTPNSLFRMEAVAGGSVSEIARHVPLYFKLEAVVGMKDIALFLPGIPEALEKEKVNVNAEFNYRTDSLQIDRLSLAMPGSFRIEGRGSVASWQDRQTLSGSMEIKGELEASQLVNLWLKEGIDFLAPLNFALHVEAGNGVIRPDLRLSQGEGFIGLSGVYGWSEESYSLRVRADRFSLEPFFPSGSWGLLTAETEIKGRGRQSPVANAQLMLDVQALGYNGHVYTGIGATVGVVGPHLKSVLKSTDPALRLDLEIQADSVDHQYLCRVKGKVENANLKALNLLSQEWRISMEAEINASASPHDNYAFNAEFTGITADNGRETQDLGGMIIRLNSNRHNTGLHVASGDFRLHFQGDTSVVSLPAVFARVAEELKRQITDRTMDMDRLGRLFPRFTLDVKGDTDNLVGKYLKTYGIGFRNMNMRAGASPEFGMRLSAEIIRLQVGKAVGDTVVLQMVQEAQGIRYNAEVTGGNGAMAELHRVGLSGFVGQHPDRSAVDFLLYQNGGERGVAKGVLSVPAVGHAMELSLEIPSLPLGWINAFIPDNTVVLYGDLYGKMNLSGMPDSLSVDGSLAFRGAGGEVVMLGTRFALDSVVVPVRQGKIELNGFGITAPNKSRLEMDGELTLLPGRAMNCNLSLRADDFQVVDVKKNETSWVYGNAYIDLDVGLNGPFDALDLTGRVNLRDNTVLDYVLRNSLSGLEEHTRDLVRFVSFGDSTLTGRDELTNRIHAGGFSMKLLVDINKAVTMNINLSEDGNDRVIVRGGGNLIYSMNPENGNNLVGKYVLDGGMVRYGIPVVGEKNFTIQGGSYIEWTGKLLNPILRITAVMPVRVNVTEDNRSSRMVNFEVLIRIEEDLRQPRIVFDLTAPNDQSIQTQLAAFSAEERTKQAMNLLIYGTYTAPGTVNAGTNANNTLNNFVEKELNQWTRRYLKNTNLTFGIDTYNQMNADGQGGKRTDYSYQFSKQLFNDKVRVKVGGRISSDNAPGTSMEDNLIDDVSVEYMFKRNRNLFMKVFRHTNYESILEGEVTQTGVGIVWRKSFRRLKEIFKRKD